MALFIPLFTVGTCILLITYVNTQQGIRLAANEPQEWMARDAASRIASGISAIKVLAGSSVQISTSQSPYLIAYDALGNTTAATGLFENKVSQLPQGVFDHARDHGVSRLTWEPVKGSWQAIVVVPIGHGELGYVLAGRSLAYAEEQEQLLSERTVFGWLVLVLISLVTSFVCAFVLRRRAV